MLLKYLAFYHIGSGSLRVVCTCFRKLRSNPGAGGWDEGKLKVNESNPFVSRTYHLLVTLGQVMCSKSQKTWTDGQELRKNSRKGRAGYRVGIIHFLFHHSDCENYTSVVPNNRVSSQMSVINYFDEKEVKA